MKHTLEGGHLPFLPEEIITNILKRLPVKSLIRFQCVCKHWKNLIKTPSFIQHHLHHHSTYQNPSLLVKITRKDDPPKICLLDCEMHFHEFESTPSIGSLADVPAVVGSCNGLICLVDWKMNPPAPLLWNPAIREVRQMPITYDDISDDWVFGFGFCPLTNDYKIVRISENELIREVEVYSLSTGSWRNIDFDSIKEVFIYGDGVTVNGVMFWRGSRLGLGDSDDTDVIISLDLATEVFTEMPLPALLSDVGVKLGVYEEKLAIISGPLSRYLDLSCTFFGVMEEGDIASGERWIWREKYRVISTTCNLLVGTIWRNQMVYIDNKIPGLIGEAECGMKNAEPKVDLHLINVTTEEHKRYAIPIHGYCFPVGIYNHVESLVSIEEP